MGEPAPSGKLIQRNARASAESTDHLVNVESAQPRRQETQDSSARRHCIYKVPDHLIKLKEQSYTPQVISIGPLQDHDNKKFKFMENYKATYYTDFMRRAKITDGKILQSIVEDKEPMVRECYEETFFQDNNDKFVQMILHDATFIIEYFLRCKFPEYRTDQDKAVIKPAWRAARMKVDFLLLENQLPFFIIEELYKLLLSTDDNSYPLSFIDVTFYYFESYNIQRQKPSEVKNIRHFLDLLRKFYLPLPERLTSDIIRSRNVSKCAEEMYCASQLAEAGLNFKKSASRCPLDLKFKDGVLEIPSFTLDKYTELYARNLVAFEQLHHQPPEAYVTDYFRFLDFLIDTDKDVRLLRRKNILVNRLGANCATIVNNLISTDVADTPSTAYYQLCWDLVRFHDNPWNWKSWKIKIRRDLSTPWVIVTTISAIFLVLLTLVQTVCTIIQTVK